MALWFGGSRSETPQSAVQSASPNMDEVLRSTIGVAENARQQKWRRTVSVLRL